MLARSSLRSRASMGLPEGNVRSIVYSPSAKATVVSIEDSSGETPVCRLFWRNSRWRKYRHLGHPDSMTSFESPVTSSDAPYVFFLVRRMIRLNEGFGGGQTRLGIGHLEGRGRVTIAEVRDGVHDTAMPIAFVLGASARGNAVFCSIPFGAHRPGPRGSVAYKICRVDVRSMSVTPLFELPGVWF
jgi:hypothetical protein